MTTALPKSLSARALCGQAKHIHPCVSCSAGGRALKARWLKNSAASAAAPFTFRSKTVPVFPAFSFSCRIIFLQAVDLWGLLPAVPDRCCTTCGRACGRG